MVERSLGIARELEADDRLDMSGTWRLAFWGGGAAVMLVFAVIAVSSDIGTRRLSTAMGSTGATKQPAVRSFDAQAETRRLTEQLRALSADRDKLMTRLNALERQFENVTGSVNREIRAMRDAVKSAAPAPTATAPSKPLPTASAAPDATAKPKAAAAPEPPPTSKPATMKPVATAAPTTPVHQPEPMTTASVPSAVSSGGALPGQLAPPAPPLRPVAGTAPQPTGRPHINAIPLAPLQPVATAAPPVDTTAMRTEFGVDIAAAPTVEALRAHWQVLRQAHPKLLEGLRPVVAIHDLSKRHKVELRLVVGPLNDAAAAAKLCAALVTAGLPSCRSTVFEGQRLALR